jgi:hypothetical protein
MVDSSAFDYLLLWSDRHWPVAASVPDDARLSKGESVCIYDTSTHTYIGSNYYLLESSFGAHNSTAIFLRAEWIHWLRMATILFKLADIFLHLLANFVVISTFSLFSSLEASSKQLRFA